MIKLKYSPRFKALKNQKGSLAIDFIFAFTMIFGFTLIMFSFALTLTAVEMTQYLTFTSARAYFASHLDQSKQSEQAAKKYDELLAQEGYSFLNKSSWFEIGNRYIGNLQGHPEGEMQEYLPSGGNPNRFEGVVVSFIARILSMNSSFLGSTEPSGDGTGSTFATRIASYLGREPTTDECKKFIDERWKHIRQLSVVGGNAPYSTGTDENAYFAMADNGC